MTTLERRIEALERQVAALRDAEGVRKTLCDYAIAVDEKRRDMLAGLFAEDAVFRIPAWAVEAHGRRDILSSFDDYWSRFDCPRRYFANEQIETAGTAATAFMYWHVTQARGAQSVLGWGTYDWAFARAGERWLITSELVNILAMTTIARGWAGADKLAPLD